MIYALNLFNLMPGAEGAYREYVRKAASLIAGVGGQVVCAGHQPVRHMTTDDRPRDRFIVVVFPSADAFESFLLRGEERGLHPLRLASTRDYIWTVFEPWDLEAWMRR